MLRLCLVACSCLLNLVVLAPAFAQGAPEGTPAAEGAQPLSPAADTEVAAPAAVDPVAPTPAAVPKTEQPAVRDAASGAALPSKPPVLADSRAVPPPATPAWTPVYSGSFFSRLELRSGYSDLGVARPPRFLDGDAVFYRARFGLGTGLIDVGSHLRAGFFMSPQAAGVMGTLPNTTTDANLGLHEGYARIQGRIVRLDAGRFELNYGDSLILGNLDWNETGRSFDGARARIQSSADSAWLDLFATFIDEGRPDITHVNDGDLYFMGLYAGLGPWLGKSIDLDAYAFVRAFPETRGLKVDPTLPTSATYLRERAGEATFGARAKQRVGMIDYRFEAGLQAGSRPRAAPGSATPTPVPDQAARDVFAYHADMEVGLNVVPERLRVGAEGIYASGDDPGTNDRNEGWDELYPTAHKFLGLSDAFAQNGIKRTNVMSGVLHATTSPLTGLTIQADGHLLARVQKGQADKGIAAVEIDLSVDYTLARGLKLRGLYALFLPKEAQYPAGNAAARADAAQFGELELRYDLN